MGSAAEDWLTIESHKRYGGRVLVRFGRSDRGGRENNVLERFSDWRVMVISPCPDLLRARSRPRLYVSSPPVSPSRKDSVAPGASRSSLETAIVMPDARPRSF